MKFFLIMNPGSRGGKSRKYFSRIFELLKQSGVDFENRITLNLEEACQLSSSANRKGFDAIVAVGGDGTINRVLNGFFNEKGERVSGAKMGIIYTGTSPDFCKSYRIPYKRTDRAVKALLGNKSRPIPVGRITMAESFMPHYDNKTVDSAPGFISRYFACCSNIGLGAMLAEFSNSGIRKYIGDFAGTFASLLRTLSVYKPSDFTISRDGRTEILEKLYNLSVGLTFYIASGIKVSHDLKDNDGRFYNLAVQKLKLAGLPGCFKTIYSGEKIKDSRTVRLSYCRSIEIHGNNRNPRVEFDGDPQGYLPCRIEMAADRLDLITEEADGL